MDTSLSSEDDFVAQLQEFGLRRVKAMKLPHGVDWGGCNGPPQRNHHLVGHGDVIPTQEGETSTVQREEDTRAECGRHPTRTVTRKTVSTRNARAAAGSNLSHSSGDLDRFLAMKRKQIAVKLQKEESESSDEDAKRHRHVSVPVAHKTDATRKRHLTTVDKVAAARPGEIPLIVVLSASSSEAVSMSSSSPSLPALLIGTIWYTLLTEEPISHKIGRGISQQRQQQQLQLSTCIHKSAPMYFSWY